MSFRRPNTGAFKIFNAGYGTPYVDMLNSDKYKQRERSKLIYKPIEDLDKDDFDSISSHDEENSPNELEKGFDDLMVDATAKDIDKLKIENPCIYCGSKRNKYTFPSEFEKSKICVGCFYNPNLFDYEKRRSNNNLTISDVENSKRNINLEPVIQPMK